MSERLNQLLLRKDLDALLFFSPENLRYLTGFSGGEGVVCFRPQGISLLVDFRYFEEAKLEAKGCEVHLLKQGMRGLREYLKERRFRRVGLEARAITLSGFQEILQEGIEFLPLTHELDPLRAVKTPEEVKKIQEAVRIAERAFEEVLEDVRPGLREIDLALELEYRMRAMGSEGVAFEAIVLSGPRTALPHGRPSRRPIREGEVVLFDFGARVGGYCSDKTRTAFLGKADPELRRVYEVVLEAHDRALDAVRAGVSFREVDRAARQVIEDAGYGEFFGHSTGHGVGLAVHEFPSLSPDSEGILEEGMVITIEPGIYLPQKGGVRIEDLVLVKDNGCEVLTKRDCELKIL